MNIASDAAGGKYYLSYNTTVTIFDPKTMAYGWHSAEVHTLQRVADCLMKLPWSPIQWKTPHRQAKNYLRANLCVLDFDDSELSLTQACKSFCDMAHIIGTTKSHLLQGRGECFRVVLVFEKTIEDPLQYGQNIARQIKIYGCDPAPKDSARFFFPCKEIISLAEEGYIIPVQDCIQPKVIDYNLKYKNYREMGIIPDTVQALLNTSVPKGQKHNFVLPLAGKLQALGKSDSEILQILLGSKVFEGTLEEEKEGVVVGLEKILLWLRRKENDR